MKRQLEEVVLAAAQLDCAALAEARDTLGRLYTEKAAPLSEAFFGTADVFRQQVLVPLAHAEHFSWLLEWRAVSQRWCAEIGQLRHLRLIDMLHPDGVRALRRLMALMPRVDSLHTDVRLLWWQDAVPHLKSLQIGDDCATGARLSISGLTNLQTLQVHQLSNSHNLWGLETLTTLTRLECPAVCLTAPDQLTRLVSLAHLCLTDFNEALAQPLTALRALRWLESNAPRHFLGYSGGGVLQGDESQDTEAMAALFDPIERVDCDYSYAFHGCWVRGLFSGQAVYYPDDETRYEGALVDGRRHGPGRENRWQELGAGHPILCWASGTWCAGRRHGEFRRWSGGGRPAPTQRWEHGVYVGEQ